MKNKYYKVKDIDKVLHCIVGTKESQRPMSKDGYWLVKLFENDKKIHECLKDCEEVKDLHKELYNERWQ